jgi:hypothetical protein
MIIELIIAKPTKEYQGRWATFICCILSVEHFGNRSEKVYHSQQVFGLCCALCCECRTYGEWLNCTALIKISSIIGMCDVRGGIIGLVTGINGGRVGKYHTIGIK